MDNLTQSRWELRTLTYLPFIERKKNSSLTRIHCRRRRTLVENAVPRNLLLNLVKINASYRVERIKAAFHFVFLELGCFVNTDLLWRLAALSPLVQMQWRSR